MKLKIALLCLLSLFSTTTAYAAEINVNGTRIPISNSNYVGFTLDTNNISYVQSIIDSHQVAVSNTPLDVNDGSSTHLMAHNPGLFTVITDSIYNGAIYVVTDDNGDKQAYQFYYVGQIEAFTALYPSNPIYQAVFLTGEEAISLQYCAHVTNTPQIWLGRPVAMPAEKPVEKVEEPVKEVEAPVEEEKDTDGITPARIEVMVKVAKAKYEVENESK